MQREFRQVRAQHLGRDGGSLPQVRQRTGEKEFLLVCQQGQPRDGRGGARSRRLRAIGLIDRIGVGGSPTRVQEARPFRPGRVCVRPVTSTSFSSRSGREFTIRDLQPEDAELLVDLFHHLSPDTIYKRFHTVLDPAKLPPERVRQEAERLARVDPETAVALLVLHGEEAVGVARFHRIPGTEDAESAIVIRDDYHKDGLGTFLLQQLGERAQAQGIHHLVAIVQAQNHPILKVINRSGLECKWRFERGETYLAVDIRTG